MLSENLKILMIVNNKEDMLKLKNMLESQNKFIFDLKCAETLIKSFEIISEDNIDITLLDLNLPDQYELEVVSKFREKFPDTPLIVLTSFNDEKLAFSALRLGAQDYLEKGLFNIDMLIRSIRYSIDKNKLELTLKSLSVIDDMTLLYNKRGFLKEASDHRKISKRNKKDFLILFTEIDNIKFINDTFGNREGDWAILDFSNILKKTFREVDIIARLETNKFTILLRDTDLKIKEILFSRLEKNLEKFNSEERKYRLSINLELILIGPDSDINIEKLLQRND